MAPDTILFILAAVLTVISVGLYLHPVTRPFARKYLKYVVVVIATLVGAALILGLRQKPRVSGGASKTDAIIKEAQSKIQIINLEEQLELERAKVDLAEAQGKHDQIASEIDNAKNIENVDDRLEELSRLSNLLL